jgi:hypothetical protein
MKTFRTIRGPFRERPHFDDGDVEAICMDELQKANLLPAIAGPINIELFVERRFKVNVEPAMLPDGILGYTEFGTNGVQGVFVSQQLDDDESKAGKRRLRSTIAHEAGHGLLHAYLFGLDAGTPLFGDLSNPAAPKVLCRDQGTYSGEWWEFQANMVMGTILMPKHLVSQTVSTFLVSAGSFGQMVIPANRFDQAVRHLAEIFDVNPALATIRLEKIYAREAAQLSL